MRLRRVVAVLVAGAALFASALAAAPAGAGTAKGPRGPAGPPAATRAGGPVGPASVYSFGDASYYGSTGGVRGASPLVGMAATPSGHGYWLVAATTPVRVTPPPSLRVSVYFSRSGVAACTAVYPVPRLVQPPQVLAGAMTALLAGPTAVERAAGYTSFFSSATAGMLNYAHVDPSGTARIDFANFSTLIPNASSSCGSQALLAALDRTATQFASVTWAVYSFNGNVSAFYNWLQLAPPATSSGNSTTPVLASALNQSYAQERTLTATYGNVISALGSVGPFRNIVTAEDQHVGVVTTLAANHHVTLGAGPYPGKASPATLRAACQLAAGLEQTTVSLYTKLMPSVTSWRDVTQAFGNLRQAAVQHLSAFEKCS